MIKELLLALCLTQPVQVIVGTDNSLSQAHEGSLCILDEDDNWTAAAYSEPDRGFVALKQIVNLQTQYVKYNEQGATVKERTFRIHGQIKEFKTIGEFGCGYSTSFELKDGQTVRKSWIWGFNLARARNLREDYFEGVTITAMCSTNYRVYFFAHNGDVYEANPNTREIFRFARLIRPGVTDACFDSVRMWVTGDGINFSLYWFTPESSSWDALDRWEIRDKTDDFIADINLISVDCYFNRTVILTTNNIYSYFNNNRIAERPVNHALFGEVSLDRLGNAWYYVGNERMIYRNTYDLSTRQGIETDNKVNFITTVKF